MSRIPTHKTNIINSIPGNCTFFAIFSHDVKFRVSHPRFTRSLAFAGKINLPLHLSLVLGSAISRWFHSVGNGTNFSTGLIRKWWTWIATAIRGKPRLCIGWFSRNINISLWVISALIVLRQPWPTTSYYKWPWDDALQSIRVDIVNWIATYIPIRIHPTLQSNRIRCQIPPRPWIIIPKIVVMKSRYRIKHLTRKAQIINEPSRTRRTFILQCCPKRVSRLPTPATSCKQWVSLIAD